MLGRQPRETRRDKRRAAEQSAHELSPDLFPPSRYDVFDQEDYVDEPEDLGTADATNVPQHARPTDLGEGLEIPRVEVTDEAVAGDEPEVTDAVWQWVMPSRSDHVISAVAPYAGRAQVGDEGGMLRVVPKIGGSFSGPQVPDSSVDAGEVSDDVSLGVVSMRGPGHHINGKPRQDAYAIARDKAWIVVAIADGVSGARLSHASAADASKVAATETLRWLGSTPVEELDWVAIADKTRDAVRDLGVRRAKQQVAPGDEQLDISDSAVAQILATTCDVIVSPVHRIDGVLRVTRARITGDGSFYVLDPQRGWAVVSAGKDMESGTVDNGVDWPLPLAGPAPIVQTWDLEPGQAAVLCTDGFGDVIAGGTRPVARYLFSEWRSPLDTTRLLLTASFVNVNADDDRTAAILWAT